MVYSLSGKKVWVAGHAGMVGSALMRRLQKENCQLLTCTRDQVDLCNPAAVKAWVAKQQPHAVFLAAAKVGGIHANNTYPVDFLEQNLLIATNIIQASYQHGCEKLLFLGSTCIYPKFAEQPIQEESLLTGALEPTNEWYAIAKIAGLKLCQAYRQQYGADFITAMPTNLYGMNDNFDLNSSHVLPALLRKAHEAKRANADSMTVWGSGKPLREFLYVDDLADACVHLMQHYSDAMPVNIGTGSDISIADLALLIKEIVGFQGKLIFDNSKPDGTPRKLTSVARLHATGWQAQTPLDEGIRTVYAWFCKQYDQIAA